MNATFLAAVRANGGPGSDIRTASGTIPGHVHPPTEPSPGFSSARLSSFNSAAQRPAHVQVASAAPNWAGGVNVAAAEQQASHPQRTEKTEPEGKPASASTVMIGGAAPLAPAGSLQNDFGIPR